MSDEVLSNLLAGVGRGDQELVDPREGEHEAVVQEVHLAQNSPQAENRYAVIVTYGGMTDSEGREFAIDDRITLPASDAKDVILRMFQQSLHTFGFVSREDRRPYFADTEEQRESFLKVFKTLEGSRWPVKIAIKNGFPRVNIRRVRG